MNTTAPLQPTNLTALQIGADLTSNSTHQVTEQNPDETSADTFMLAGNLLIGIIGILGNVIVILVIQSNKEMMKKLVNLFFLNQSVIDCTFCVCLIIVYPIQYATNPADLSGWKGKLFCSLVDAEAILFGLLNSSTYNLLSLTTERYLGIVKPIWHKIHLTNTAAYVLMAGSWIIGLVFSAVYILPTSYFEDGACYRFTMSEIVAHVVNALVLIVAYFFPIVWILVCYIRIVISLRSRVGIEEAENEANPRSKIMARVRRNTLRTLFTVLGLFTLCWTYSIIPYTLMRLKRLPYSFWDTYWGKLAGMAPSVNCMVNPFVYAIQYQEFQKSLLKFFGIERPARSIANPRTTSISAPQKN